MFVGIMVSGSRSENEGRPGEVEVGERVSTLSSESLPESVETGVSLRFGGLMG